MRKILGALAVLALFGLGVVNASPARAETYPSGWSDATEGGGVNTLDSGSSKVVVATQYFRSGASSDPWQTVTAVRARCSIRKEGSTTGVKINVCALGVKGGAKLTEDGEFLDGGTCCANGFSPLRYVNSPPSRCCVGFAGRATYSWRAAGILLGPVNFSNSGGASVFNLG